MKRLMTTLLVVLLGWTGFCFAEGVTVSGSVKVSQYGSMRNGKYEATVSLVQNDAIQYSAQLAYSKAVDGYTDSTTYVFENVTAGNYTLKFACEFNETYYTYSTTVAVSTDNVTQNIEASQDADFSIMKVTIQYGEWYEYAPGSGYWTNTKNIAGATVVCKQQNATDDGVSKTSNTSGVVTFIVANNEDLRYSLNIQAESYAAKDTIIAGYGDYYGSKQGLSHDIYINEDPNWDSVMLSGTISGGTLPAETQIGLKTVRGALVTAPVSGNTYAFAQKVPVGTSTFFLYDPTGKSTYEFGPSTNVSYNFGIKSPEGGNVSLTANATGLTQDIEIERIAVNVSGTINGANNNSIDVALVQDNKQVHTTRSNLVGEYTFQGVTPGTYTVKTRLYGYDQKNEPTVTVTSIEAGDVTADAITMEAQEMTFTIQNTYFQPRNEYTGKYDPLDGAKIEIWSVNEDGTKNEKLTETTVNANGQEYSTWSVQVTAKMGTRCMLRITHASIEDYEELITLNQQSINSYPQIEFKYDGPRPLLAENFRYAWDDAKDSLTLTWTWPDTLGKSDTFQINHINLSLKRSSDQYGKTVKSWRPSGDAFTFDELPTSFKDTLTDGFLYIYTFSVSYTKPYSKTLDTSFEVDFRPDYTLTYAANDAAWGTVESETASGSKLKEGVLFKLIAKATKEGYRFKAWKDADQDKELGKRDTATFPMPARDFNVQAVFEQYIFTIAAAADDAAHGDVTGGQKYELGEDVTLTATPKDGYKFVGWKEGETIVSTEATYTFKADKDRSLTAVFKYNRFVITLNATPENAGTVSGGGTLDGDTEATVKATPNAGYKFVGWKEGDETVSIKAEYTFKVEADRTLTAVFEEVKYVLGLGVNKDGWGKVEGAGEFKAGTEVTAKAIANEGYKFVAWTEGEEEVSTDANYTFKLEKDRTLTAVFEETTTYYTVTLQANKAEWGKVEGGDKYAAGANATIKATANKGYKFVAWMEGETEVSKDAVYTFKVEKDITLTAVFAEGAANEEFEAARWTVYAENGTLVINGLNGDRYAVYDLNGRLAGQALCTGAEIRMDVAPNKLYIVRRISAAGLFGAKKIVVR